MIDYEIKEILKLHREFFDSHRTDSIKFRKRMLKRLKVALEVYDQQIVSAVKDDLGKSNVETYMSEIGMVLEEINWMMRHMKKLSKDKRARTPLAQFHSKSFISPKPYGTVLIISPWNYPLLLTLGPLVDAIAAGNTVVIKPSEYTPKTTKVICDIVKECFPPAYVAVVEGDAKTNKVILAQKFDKIFFTGSTRVGAEVMKAAAKTLTPVTLELGGKSPCIVDKSAKIPLAAKRIVFGKFLNCGQTCVAPDYILCQESIKDKLVQAIIEEIRKQFGSQPLQNPDYGKIINKGHFERLNGLIDKDKVVWGGQSNLDREQIEPTVMDKVTWSDPIMQDEIFGPILPILTYKKLKHAIKEVNDRPHPLALYLFTENKKVKKKVLKNCQFGGGCINDTVIHLATTNMPFGGVGASGMGSYHGKAGFECFTHYRSIVDKKTWLDIPLRYQPYSSVKHWLIKKFMG